MSCRTETPITIIPTIEKDVIFTPTIGNTNNEFILKWKYPDTISSNLYIYSLETTTNFVNWDVVTNYPFGYTNDVYYTNDYFPVRLFRMHGVWP